MLKTNMSIVQLSKNFSCSNVLNRMGFFFFVKFNFQALVCIIYAYTVLSTMCPDLALNIQALV